MAGVEMIGLLCAGCMNYHAQVRGTANAGMTKADLAGLLSGLTPIQMHLALAKYGLDIDSERYLIAHTQVYAADLVNRFGWKIVKRRPTVSNMSALACFEIIRPNVCSRCRGNGTIARRVCTKCDGGCFGKLSGRVIAEAIGVDQANWSRVWSTRYEMIYSFVQRIESEMIYTLKSADRELYFA